MKGENVASIFRKAVIIFYPFQNRKKSQPMNVVPVHNFHIHFGQKKKSEEKEIKRRKSKSNDKANKNKSFFFLLSFSRQISIHLDNI